MTADSIQLSIATSRTKTGPRLRGDTRQVVVEYDFERDDGAIVWAAVTFEEVLDYEFRSMPCCTVEDVGSMAEVTVIAASERLSTTMQRWQDAVGRQDWQQKQGGSSRFKHYKLYFDDAGCVDVIAVACHPSEAFRGELL